MTKKDKLKQLVATILIVMGIFGVIILITLGLEWREAHMIDEADNSHIANFCTCLIAIVLILEFAIQIKPKSKK